MKLINLSSTNIHDLAPAVPGAEVKIGDNIIDETGTCWVIIGFGTGGAYGSHVQAVESSRLEGILERFRPSSLDLAIELEN